MVGSVSPEPLYPGEFYHGVPVHCDESAGGWRVLRHADVRRVLTDHAVFSSAVPWPDHLPPIFLLMDDPWHARLRALAEPAFHTIQRLTARIQQRVDECLRPLLGRGGGDLVAELARPVPALVTADLLGLADPDPAQLYRWIGAVADADSILSLGATPGFEERADLTPRDRLRALFERPERSAAVRGCPLHNAAVELTDATHPGRAVIVANKRQFLQPLVDTGREASADDPDTLGQQWPRPTRRRWPRRGASR